MWGSAQNDCFFVPVSLLVAAWSGVVGSAAAAAAAFLPPAPPRPLFPRPPPRFRPRPDGPGWGSTSEAAEAKKGEHRM